MILALPNKYRQGFQNIKETVQGTCDSDSTCLYSAIAKPNMTIKTKKLSTFCNYLALICKAEIPYLPPFYTRLNHKFLIHFPWFKKSLSVRLVPTDWLDGFNFQNNQITFEYSSLLCCFAFSPLLL